MQRCDRDAIRQLLLEVMNIHFDVIDSIILHYLAIPKVRVTTPHSYFDDN
jgi:hypothetical protein